MEKPVAARISQMFQFVLVVCKCVCARARARARARACERASERACVYKFVISVGARK